MTAKEKFLEKRNLWKNQAALDKSHRYNNYSINIIEHVYLSGANESITRILNPDWRIKKWIQNITILLI